MPQLPSDSLFYDREPLVINPVIAEKVGLNEAIILHQVQYWQNINEAKKQNLREGQYWTYNTYEEWQKQFPWWSCDTIKRAIHRLEKEGLLVSANYNTLKIDRTKWYRVNFDHPLLRRASSIGAKCPDEGGSLPSPLPETTTETTTSTTNVGDAAASPTEALSKKKAHKEPNPDGSYDDPDVTAVCAYFKEKLGRTRIDKSDKWNRIMASNLLRGEPDGLAGVKRLIDRLAQDDFWPPNITSLHDLYDKREKITQRGLAREASQHAINTAVTVDEQGIIRGQGFIDISNITSSGN